MAELLRDEDSTDRHLSQARRHQRRCKQTPGAGAFADTIEGPRAALASASTATAAAEDAEEDAIDDLEAAGRDGGDVVRNLSAGCKEHDRKNPGDQTHATIFGGDGFSDYIHDDGTVEALTLDGLAAKTKTFGDSHSLAPRVSELSAAVTRIRGAEAAVKTTTEARALAQATEELAQAALRRAYEANYLDSRKKFGKDAAERLFMRTRRRKKAAVPGPSPMPPV